MSETLYPRFKACEGCGELFPWPEPNVRKHHRQAWSRHQESCPVRVDQRKQQQQERDEIEERINDWERGTKIASLRTILLKEFTSRQANAVISALSELDLV